MFETNEVLLKNLLNIVESGKLQLPDFQRGWVWDDDRIRGLLASISRGFPIGAVMTLSAGGDIKFKTRLIEGVEQEEAKAPSAFLLDGQQRLTSLYQSLRYPGPVDTSNGKKQRIRRWYYISMLLALEPDADREDAIISVPENRIETADFGRTIVRDLSSQDKEYEEHMFPTERLMDPFKWAMGYVRYWESADKRYPQGKPSDFIDQFDEAVLGKFQDYQLPVIKLNAETPKEAVCTVFEKVNTGGEPLKMFELATASFAADADALNMREFTLRDDWEKRKSRMYKHGVLQGIDGDRFLQTVALLKTQETRRKAIQNGTPVTQAPAVGCKKKDILDLHLSDYLRWADKVEHGFTKAAKFLHTQFVFGKRNVPYNTQLVPLAALYVELGSELETVIARERLEKWYWSGVFGESYGGTIETQFALDLVEVAKFVRAGQTTRLMNEANFIPQRLISLRTRNSAAYKGVYALQMKNGASDWKSGNPLTIATYHDDNIDIHHIFPVAWCHRSRPAVQKKFYDSIINKTPVDALTNRIIGGRAPSEYLDRIGKSSRPEEFEKLLKSHWIDIRHLQVDDFVGSFVERGLHILKLIGNAMGREPNLDGGRKVFLDALKSGGQYVDMYVEEEEEHGDLGDVSDEVVEFFSQATAPVD